jgi:hypothetical protein
MHTCANLRKTKGAPASGLLEEERNPYQVSIDNWVKDDKIGVV